MTISAATVARADDFVWWRHGVIYQIYPRSFQDTDGDGVGDLNGVIQRLDYLVELGVDALWLSPIFLSPMADFGYDVADHTAIDPLFGDMAAFDRLLAEAHGRGLKLILDYVPNHTSDQHAWFVDSRSSRTSPRRDWYVWRDPAEDGGPPNNWRSEFGGPAWSLDPASGQYYYHAFLPSQPDLNWRNPDVVAAMLAVLRFWLDRGVDGFRIDAIHHLIESEDFADNPVNPQWRPDMGPAYELIREHTIDQPEVQDAVRAMRRLADAYDARVLIGEAYLPIPRMMAYYGGALDGFQLPFNFHLISTPWRPDAIADLIEDYEAALPAGGWPNWVLGNHDRSRLASRLGSDQARVAAMLLLTLRGTPTLYQGDELGLEDVAIPPERVRDPFEINVPGLGLGRDPERTPMPWSSAPNAGFSAAEPWLPFGDDWRTNNVAAQAADADSCLAFYRRLLAVRRSQPALTHGGYGAITVHGGLLAYERQLGAARFLVVLNLTGDGGDIEIPAARLVLSTDPKERRQAVEAARFSVGPNQGYVFRIETTA
jgi:alpha-glucosidase